MLSVAYTDSVGEANVQNTTRSITVPSGKKRLLLVFITAEDQGAGYNATHPVVSGVTYNGVALTKLDSSYGDNGTTIAGAEIWYLKNPDVTTANVVVSRGGTVDGTEVTSVVLTGVNLRNPFNVTNKASATTGTVWGASVTTTKPKCIVIGVNGATTGVGGGADGGQTSIVLNSNNGFTKGVAYKAADTPGAFTLTWTGNDSRWGSVVTSVRPFRPSGLAALL